MALSSTTMSSQSTLYSCGSNNQESALHSSGSNDGEIGSCFNVEGTIYGKFESGYLVSVQVGSEVLNGGLYHPEEQAPSSNAIVPKKRGRRSTKKIKDPNLPRPKWSGYTFYYVEKLPMFKSLYPTKRREFTKMIVESWRNLSRQEKRVYKNYALEDKKRYKKEWKEYNERKMVASSCNKR